VKHFASRRFWDAYDALPTSARLLADQSFELLKRDPRHPSLRLKKIGRFWSARIGLRYRALAVEAEEGLVWFWIGSHAEYDRLIEQA
jgi:hypothetical protein